MEKKISNDNYSSGKKKVYEIRSVTGYYNFTKWIYLIRAMYKYNYMQHALLRKLLEFVMYQFYVRSFLVGGIRGSVCS